MQQVINTVLVTSAGFYRTKYILCLMSPSPFSAHSTASHLRLSFCSAYSNEDQLLWRPGVLPVQEVEEFLLHAQRPQSQERAACTKIKGYTIQDNEQVQ